MKNKLKKSNNPEPGTRRSHKTVRHILRLTGFALGLSVLLALFSLLTIGLPPSLTSRIVAQIQTSGVPIQVQSIRLSPHRGWVLNNVRLYSTSPDDLQPLLSARRLYVMLWPVDWKNPATGGWSIDVYVKNLGVSLGRPWESILPDSHPFRTISRLKASLTAAPGQISIEEAELQWGNITLLTQGTAVFSAKTGNEPLQGDDFRRRAAQAADALSRLQCKKPPQLNITFNFDDTHPEKTFLDTTLTAEGIAWQTRVYEKLSGALGYRDSTWTLSTLQLDMPNHEQLILNGAINLKSSSAQVSVKNTLSASDLFNLLPAEAQSAVAQTGVKPYGRFDFTASAGPAPYIRLAEKVEVQVQQAQLKRHDITLDPLAFRLVRDGSQVTVNDLKTRANGGPLAGSFVLDLDSKAWKAKVQTQCDPILAGAYDEALREFILRFRFPAEFPKADLTLSQTGPDASLVISGTLTGDRFTCGSVPIGHLETFMVYSNRIVDLTPLHIVRAKEKFDGSIQVDLNRDLAFFNVTNSFPPADIARALAPEERTILEEIRFDGPVYAAGRGQIDYGNWTNHAFKGIFRAENIGMKKIQATLFNTDIEARGTQLIFTNAAAQLYSGLAEGSAEFDILLQDGSAPYRINARITQLSLEDLLRQVGTKGYDRTRGQLAATLDITADAKTGFWNSVRGGGKVEIKDGRMADVPLFGGFSRLIQSAFSGFNLFSLTAFSADYTLHDGAIWSDNAQLGGTLFSARGRGSYSPESGLDFTVAAEPLRQTSGGDKESSQLQRLAANVLREGTAPFFRLLEFKLEGPLEKPDWRFVNLPK